LSFLAVNRCGFVSNPCLMYLNVLATATVTPAQSPTMSASPLASQSPAPYRSPCPNTYPVVFNSMNDFCITANSDVKWRNGGSDARSSDSGYGEILLVVCQLLILLGDLQLVSRMLRWLDFI
jgi:hypothetical protein